MSAFTLHASASSTEVTAEEALALAKKFCAPLVAPGSGPVRWQVTVSDGIHNVWKGPGDYWLADGQYYPAARPGILSVIDMMLFVPKTRTTSAELLGCFKLGPPPTLEIVA